MSLDTQGQAVSQRRRARVWDSTRCDEIALVLNEREGGGQRKAETKNAGVQQVGLSSVSRLRVYREINVH